MYVYERIILLPLTFGCTVSHSEKERCILTTVCGNSLIVNCGFVPVIHEAGLHPGRSRSPGNVLPEHSAEMVRLNVIQHLAAVSILSHACDAH